MPNSANSERQNRAQQPKPIPAIPPAPVNALFRKIDWLTLLLTFATVWTVYFLTIAPELTLEDSGELVTASFYAGIPHPPGYPVWTIYTWLWTVLLPIGNMAWRVAVGEATAGALACGLLGFLVSRGSSLFMEGIEELKNMTGKWESSICIISGFAAGVLMGLDGFIWSESVVVNRVAVFSLSWVMLLLICLLRWLYAPQQLRYAYVAVFLFGICVTIHQSLLSMALAIEVTLAVGNPRLGRNAFLGNFVIYLLYLAIYLATGKHLLVQIANPAMFVVFNLIGIGSLVAGSWLAIRTTNLVNPWDWLHIIIMFFVFCAGVAFYFYMPISGMTIAPMQWGYPRTVEGFFHALSRGQYEQPNPTNVMKDPGRFIGQLWLLLCGASDEFTWVYLLLAVVPFLFFFRMQKRERSWLISISSMYLCLGVLLTILFNPQPERSSADLLRVFFTSSHAVIALLIGYGLALTASFMATNYQRFRLWGLAGGAVGLLLALYCLVDATGKNYFGRAGWASYFGRDSWASFWMGIPETPHWIAQAFQKNQFGLSIFANLLLVAIAVAFVGALLIYRRRGPLLVVLGLFTLMPLSTGLDHWFDSEQRNHWFGYWFGHDMFSPPFTGKNGQPLYPQMTKDAVLFGGTDPGRFCPEYIIYTESFTPHDCQPKEDQKFDRRDVYIITQNALADHTYLNFIRSHYNRSAQIDPPFFSELFHTRLVAPLDWLFTWWGEKVEKKRRTYTSWFVETNFTNLPALAAKLRPGPQQDPVSKYLYENVSAKTQQLLAAGKDDDSLRSSLTRDLNLMLEREQDLKQQLAAKQKEKESVDQQLLEGVNSEKLRRRQQQLAGEIADLSKVGRLYDPERFKQVHIDDYLADFIKENPQSDTRVRLNRLLLEAAYPNEIAKSIGGVYPDREIYCPSELDSQKCFQTYMDDAAKRLQHDQQFPNEPRQIKPGEDVHPDGGKVTVSGQVAVMAINGLLTEVIFNANPKNEFFVEESFPLDWMYPHLTPFGVIMKINRQALPDLSEDVLQRDHDFWKQYADKRFIGDVVDYGTPVKNVVEWIEKTYLHRNFEGFTGSRAFVRDDDAQKSFSKLRSSIAGIYAWRLSQPPGSPYRPKTEADYQRLLKEADFAFLQAFTFCPYSPEAVFRYVNLLVQFRRFDDAILIAETCLKFDPFNGSMAGLVENLKAIKQQQVGVLDDALHRAPGNFEIAFEVAGSYLQMQDTNRATQILDAALNQPGVTVTNVLRAAHLYFEMGNLAKVESTLNKLTQVVPSSPEAWYDLAGIRTALGQKTQAIPALKQALDLSAKRLAQDRTAADLQALARVDAQFNPIRSSPEFAQLVAQAPSNALPLPESPK